MNAAQLERIYFKLDPTDWHGHASEGLWGASVSETLYRLMNSPFFARVVSNQDLVRVSINSADGSLEFLEMIEGGGHSTFMILIDQKFQGLAKSVERIGTRGM